MVYQFIERTAIPAWGPQQSQPLIAAGTVAGAMDATFSNTSTLELFQLSSDDSDKSLESLSKVEANARFQRLAWSASSGPGVIAGGLENGDITVWDARKLLDHDDAPVVHTSSAHTGSVGGLEFNPFAPNLMASGSANGEVFIWDIVSDFKSYSPGPRSQRLDLVTDLCWNNQVQHILATASNSGSLVVWDLRSRREVISLGSVGAIGQGSSRPGISAAEWNPQSATQLVTASSDDSSPVVMLWDLRNAQAPSSTLAGGHQRGILSLSWCRKDSGLLLSSGKDNRTVCWNPESGAIVGELPPSSNWVYDVQWNQANPNLLSGASFDGRISLYSLSRESDSPVDDPFAPRASTPFAPSLSLKSPPKWLARPCGASFGFGGQLVHFNQTGPLVSISEFVSEPELAQQAQRLEDVLEGGRAAELCGERAQGGEREWQVLQILFEEDARDKLVRFLGFDKDQVKARIKDLVKPTTPIEEKKEAEEEEEENPFASSSADGDDFFDKPPPPQAVDDLAVAFSGAFRIYDKSKDIGSEDADGLITRAILLGDVEAAVTLCMEQELFADALILAPYGSPDLAARVQKEYFAKRAQQAAYVRLLHAIVSGDLSDIVSNADLSEWDEVLALLCTYAQGDQFSALCEALGQRLLREGEGGNAVVCFLASGNLDKVAGIWIEDKKDVRTLHELVERVAVFRSAVQFVDSGVEPFLLAPLYDCYVEYAGVLAAQGLFDIAAKYLDRVPADYQASAALPVLRNRLALTDITPWTVVPIGPIQQPIQPAQPVQPAQQPVQQLVQPPVQQQQQQQMYGAYPTAYPTTTMPAAQHYSTAQPAYPSGGFAPAYQQPGVFQPPPPQPLNPASIPTGFTPPPRRDDVPWNDPPMMAKAAKRPSQAVAKPSAIVSPFPNGRDTPPPAQMAQTVGPPRGGFVPNTGKSLPPPPPGFAPPSQPPVHPGFVPQPMQMQPGFVPQPMPAHQQQAPPQSMRGQIVSAPPPARPDAVASAAAIAAAAVPKAAGPKYPSGDRSHLPEEWKPTVAGLMGHLARAKQFAAPGQKRMVEDAERRLLALFDSMNCDEVKGKEKLVPLFEGVVQNIDARHFAAALNVQAEIMAVSPELTSSVVGVKHLVNVLKTLPM
ncbi:protein transport protein S31 [Coemansia sp. RSA 2675]|nr:protein transport protein S31 [Coemansia sp. RSA 2675]